MRASTLDVDAPRADGMTSCRLAVAWQHPVTRAMAPVGVLTVASGGFSFAYLRSAVHVAGFQPFLGFPDWDRRYVSDRLFPLFAQRVMRTSRPDYQRYLQSLRLAADASDWAILGRSQGHREGDGIRLFPEPVVQPDGSTQSTFFANGLRHRLVEDSQVGAALGRLEPGADLHLVPEPDNPVDQRALLVATASGVALAWVPSVLLDYVHSLRAAGTAALRLEAVNGDDTPPGYRLLVTASGRMATGAAPFFGDAWETDLHRA